MHVPSRDRPRGGGQALLSSVDVSLGASSRRLWANGGLFGICHAQPAYARCGGRSQTQPFFFSFLWRPHSLGVMGKAGRPFRPFRASGIAPSVGGATAVFFSLVVRRMKSKAKTRVGKPSDSVESAGIAPLRKPNPRRADPPGFNPLLISSLKPLNVR